MKKFICYMCKPIFLSVFLYFVFFKENKPNVCKPYQFTCLAHGTETDRT